MTPKKENHENLDLARRLERLDRRHRALLGRLAPVGFVLRGSIARRSTHCGQPTCRCKASPPQLHGPYDIWTRKVAGKTVTAQLPPSEAALLRRWNRNMHRLDRIVRALQAVGLEAANAVRAAQDRRSARPPHP